jgi:hypothetical protein
MKAGVALTVIRKIEQGKRKLEFIKSKSGIKNVWTCSRTRK